MPASRCRLYGVDFHEVPLETAVTCSMVGFSYRKDEISHFFKIFENFIDCRMKMLRLGLFGEIRAVKMKNL